MKATLERQFTTSAEPKAINEIGWFDTNASGTVIGTKHVLFRGAGNPVGSTIPDTPNSFLCTKKDYANFILELEFKENPKLNSGIQIRSQCFDEDKELDLTG